MAGAQRVLDAESAHSANGALEVLCNAYWFPLYAFARRWLGEVEAAQDATQEFFLRLLEKPVLASATPERGRFRAFLLSSMKNFLANEYDRARALKRGGGQRVLSLDWEDNASRLSLHPAHEMTAERLFDRSWALALLDRVLERLRNDSAAVGKLQQFNELKVALTGDRAAIDYASIAASLAISEDAARQAAHRLRKRYRELLRDEVAQTVADPAEVEDEIRSLFHVLGA